MGFVKFLHNQFRKNDPLRAVANVRQQNRIANILNDLSVVNGEINKPTDAEGLGWSIVIPPYFSVANTVLSAPFRMTLNDATDEYSVTAGRVWTRDSDSLDVAAVSDVAIAETKWIYIPITIQTDGTESAGAIADSTTEPAYWGRDASNHTVINLVVGKITVTGGAGSVEWNTTGDIHLFSRAGQTVAPSLANSPVALHDAFADTATYASADDVLVKRGDLEGSTPGQKERLFVDNPAGSHLTVTGGQLAHVSPQTPASPATLGGASEGSESADATAGDPSASGLEVYMTSRIGYYDTGSETLYMYVRKLTFDSKGHLDSIGAETRVSVDVPEACT